MKAYVWLADSNTPSSSRASLGFCNPGMWAGFSGVTTLWLHSDGLFMFDISVNGRDVMETWRIQEDVECGTWESWFAL